jgi:Na+-transporting NADH:ubiquinone oxidoreductase subunit A
MALHRIRKGLDLPLAGSPVQTVDTRPVSRVALVAEDYVGLKPTLRVAVGAAVRRGELLFEDRRTPGLRFTAPATGIVSAVNRGERRALQSVVIDVSRDDCAATQPPFASYTGRDPASLDGAAVETLLVESGLWVALRERPYGRVARPGTRPRSIFVTAIDTRPHAPSPAVALAGRDADMARALAALAKLTDGAVYMCVGADGPGIATNGEQVRVERFAGPHPAGLPGTHIHMLDPVGPAASVWYVGYQDALAIGRLFGSGELDVGRLISLAGPAVVRPRLVHTRLGASIDELVAGELADGDVRVISGSVLDGRAARGAVHGYLGRYHQQVAALAEGRERELFGWFAPGRAKFSLWRVVAGAFARDGIALTTSTNGSARAMVPIGAYERVMPLDILPTFLLRALVTDDVERAEALGALELEEDDLALCTLVCPGKLEYGPLLRAMLTRLESETA